MSAVMMEKRYSIEDYLALEDKADSKSEYYEGEIFPTAGGTLNHNQISINLCIILGIAFKKRDFRVFAGDVKLHIPATNSFTYPDVLVINGEPSYWQNRRDTIDKSELIIEILSDSTKDYDRAGKFENYRSLPELHDYILISQDKVHIEHFEKQAFNQWLLTEYKLLDDSLKLVQIEERMSLGDIYDKIVFEK
ncbi:MAG: Uma2 family endonuclease [Methylococcales bacterium]|nr:Uma2 family endonuclease [Methylococcales bacterium]